jgi:phosphatidylglycerophosphate synthase
MKSALGAKLDSINDKIFYTLVFVFIGYKTVPLSLVLGVAILINLYGIIATYYIVPRLRKLTKVERRGLKKYFMDRGFIIGMDLGTIDILTTVFLLLNLIKPLYVVLILGLIFDIVYRLGELSYNERLDENQL